MIYNKKRTKEMWAVYLEMITQRSKNIARVNNKSIVITYWDYDIIWNYSIIEKFKDSRFRKINR